MSLYPVTNCSLESYQEGRLSQAQDLLSVEEPMEILLGVENQKQGGFRSLAITMRTPGDDLDLIRGFLYTEAIIRHCDEIISIRPCFSDDEGSGNSVKVRLSAETRFSWRHLKRHVYLNSSCGICGKASMEAVKRALPSLPGPGPLVNPEVLTSLPEKLNNQQTVFRHTGGIHAAGIFDVRGDLRYLKEDVGRHNALDKAIGAALNEGSLPLSDSILLLSGRISFELMQKAIMGGIQFIAGIGAPSSLAVEMAVKFNISLIGFLRPNRFNIYHGGHRFQRLPNKLKHEDQYKRKQSASAPKQ